MGARPISPRLHGVLDYLTAADLIVAPSLLGIADKPSGRILRAAGATHAAYSLLTRYPLGPVKVLPFRAHLALDAAAAAGLAAAPWVLGTARKGPRHWLPHLAFGLYELGAVALSDPSGNDAEQDVSARSDPKPASHPETVVPDGAEANAAIGARTIGGGDRGGVGGGTGSGGDPPAGGLQGD
jgi:hypothetical protein